VWPDWVLQENVWKKMWWDISICLKYKMTYFTGPQLFPSNLT
jgi:hypothetical protein